MQINLTGHHVDITDSLRNYVNEKFERLERHFDQVTDVHVILSVENCARKLKPPCTSAAARYLPTIPRKTCMRQSTAWRTNWIDKSESTRKNAPTTTVAKALSRNK